MDEQFFDSRIFDIQEESIDVPSQLSFDLGSGEMNLNFQSNYFPDEIKLCRDTNGDGVVDSVSEWVITEDGEYNYRKIDFDGDGQFEFASLDADGDLWPEFISIDFDGDGLHEDLSTIPVSDRGLINALAETGMDAGLQAWAEIDAQQSDVVNTGFIGVDQLVDEWPDNWHEQDSKTTCAICCQEFVIEQFTGRDMTESELCAIARDRGWYDDNGTTLEDVGKLLDLFGIDSIHKLLDFESLVRYVNSGHGVIVAVDADELWGDQGWESLLNIPDSGADHAVQVIAFDAESDEFLINDPGRSDGEGLRVKRYLFLDAWQDSRFFACVTAEKVVA